MIPLTNEENKSCRKQKVSCICKKSLVLKYYKVKDYCHCYGTYRGAAHNVCNLRYKTARKFPVASYYNERASRSISGTIRILRGNTEK